MTANIGKDDNAYSSSQFNVANVATVTCDANAACSGAACVCGTNYYGNGATCAPVTCTNNVAPGYLFDPTAVTLAGAVATTTVCPPGLVGYATRKCLWNGPTSQYGVWANPISFCQPVQCAPVTAYNATFSSVLIGNSAGSCLPGFAGTISSQCLLNITSGTTGYFSTPTGSCRLITCAAASFAAATWPPYSPYAVDTFVNGTCDPGYTPADASQPAQRQCLATGTYANTLLNTCVKLNCSADPNFGNAAWPQTESDTTVAGTCKAGYYAGAPLRYCRLDGTYDSAVVNPCVQIRCPALPNAEGTAFNATAAGTTATGSCVPGYKLAGTPQLVCNLDGTWAAGISNPCVQVMCASVTEGSVTWPPTVAGNPPTAVSGQCASGTYVAAGQPYRGCDINGNFTVIKNPCQSILCPAITTPDAASSTWPTGVAGTTVTGICPTGYSGTPTRDCTGTTTTPGQWGPVTGACTPVYCPATDFSSNIDIGADFPQALATTIAVGVCPSSTYGLPQLLCGSDGNWTTTLLRNPCSASPCPALTSDDNSDWNAGTVGNLAVGSCNDGYYVSVAPYSPQRQCTESGWDPIGPACQPITCAAAPLGNAFFSSAVFNTNATGTCVVGYGGSPTAYCNSNGVWELDVDCALLSCDAEGDDTVAFPQAAAGSTVVGVCADGYGGGPVRQCTPSGVWLQPTGTPCTRGTCNPYDDGAASFASAVSGTTGVEGICDAGYTPTDGVAPTRDCNNDLTWGPVTNQCTRLACQASLDSTSNAYFNTTLSGVLVSGYCKPGYARGDVAPTRTCSINGVWTAVVGTCNQLFCPSGNVDFNAQWPSGVPAGTYVDGAFCPPGWSGSIGRQCQMNGQWSSSATGGCVQVFCLPTDSGSVDGYAAWPITAASSIPVNITVTSCDETYIGAPVRTCNPDGTWGPVTNPCTVNFCPALAQDGNAQWPDATAGSQVQGQCITANGFTGIAVRACTPSAVWGAITTPCVPQEAPCPAIIGYQSRSNWPATQAGQTATGTCALGYTAGPNGPPLRVCLGLGTGQWDTVVTDDCVLATGGAGLSRLTSVNVTAVTANSVTLFWQAIVSATRFYVLYTSDSIHFYPAPLPGGASYMNGTVLTVGGLAEFTTYLFEVYAGDANSFDTNFYTPLPTATTTILPPVVNVSSAVTTENSIAFSWQPGSQLTDSYLVYGQRLSNNRDVPFGNLTLLANSTNTSYTATSLSSGSTYLFRVRAVGTFEGAASNTDYTFQTRAVSSQVVVPDGGTCVEARAPRRTRRTWARLTRAEARTLDWA